MKTIIFLLIYFLFNTAFSQELKSVTPIGFVKNINQATIKFSTPMVALGEFNKNTDFADLVGWTCEKVQDQGKTSGEVLVGAAVLHGIGLRRRRLSRSHRDCERSQRRRDMAASK